MREVVAGAVISGGVLLLAQRSYPPDVAGLWELPGGKVEEGETRARALERELAEELGVVVIAGPQIGVGVPLRPDLVLIALAATLVGGDPEPTEHTAVRWVGADDLRQMAAAGELVPADAVWVEDLVVLLT